jgi:hypothetical protein
VSDAKGDTRMQASQSMSFLTENLPPYDVTASFVAIPELSPVGTIVGMHNWWCLFEAKWLPHFKFVTSPMPLVL